MVPLRGTQHPLLSAAPDSKKSLEASTQEKLKNYRLGISASMMPYCVKLRENESYTEDGTGWI